MAKPMIGPGGKPMLGVGNKPLVCEADEQCCLQEIVNCSEWNARCLESSTGSRRYNIDIEAPGVWTLLGGSCTCSLRPVAAVFSDLQCDVGSTLSASSTPVSLCTGPNFEKVRLRVVVGCSVEPSDHVAVSIWQETTASDGFSTTHHLWTGSISLPFLFNHDYSVPWNSRVSNPLFGEGCIPQNSTQADATINISTAA